MSIDLHLELDASITEAAVRRCLAAAGATIDHPEGELSGQFPVSHMSFFYDVYPLPHPLRAEHATVQPMIGSSLWLRPRPSRYDEALAELRELVRALAPEGGSFVLSYQYERVMAECDRGALALRDDLVSS